MDSYWPVFALILLYKNLLLRNVQKLLQFILGRLVLMILAGTYSESFQTSKMELFSEQVNFLHKMLQCQSVVYSI